MEMNKARRTRLHYKTCIIQYSNMINMYEQEQSVIYKLGIQRVYYTTLKMGQKGTLPTRDAIGLIRVILEKLTRNPTQKDIGFRLV